MATRKVNLASLFVSLKLDGNFVDIPEAISEDDLREFIRSPHFITAVCAWKDLMQHYRKTPSEGSRS
jgi:hypothetical protein